MTIKKKIAFLPNIHYFRAFAIVNIVFVHVWRLPKSLEHTTGAIIIDQIREVLFHDSTLYFLFISGFLFHHLSPRFELGKFYKNKALYVLLPYVMLSLFFISLSFNYATQPLNVLWKQMITAIFRGKAFVQYWYIPFISLLFLFSPLLLKIPKKHLGYLTFFACLFSLLGTRTGTGITIFQYLYFAPTYLLGFYLSSNYDNFFDWIKKGKYVLVVISLVSSGLLFYGYKNDYSAFFSVINPIETIFFIQKVALICLALIGLKKLTKTTYPFLDYLARYSFGLYFLHVAIRNLLQPVFENMLVVYTIENTLFLILLSLLYAFIVLLITLLVCLLVKKIAGRFTPYLIGVK